jgi:hypothetical protein
LGERSDAGGTVDLADEMAILAATAQPIVIAPN